MKLGVHMSKHQAVQLLIAALVVFVFCRPARAANTVLMEATQACSGITSTTVKASGPIKFKDYSLSVESNGSLSVQQNGVLLKKITSFSYTDYSKCILDLTKIMVGITAPSQKIPVDIFDKVRMGEFGSTTLSFLRSALGPPNEISKTEDPAIKQADFLSDGYRISANFLPKENSRLVGLKVIIDQSSNVTRGDVVIDGYWNQSMKPGAVLGVSLMKSKFSGDCTPVVEGGIVTNSDPRYSCVGSAPHSQGWVAVKLHLERSGDEDVDGYDLSRLREQIENGPDSSWPLGPQRTQIIEKAAGVLKNDPKSTKLDKVDAALLNKLGTYRIIGFEIFNDLVGGDIK